MDLIPTSDMDMQIILDRVPDCAFWTLMDQNERVRTHIEEQANRVVEMLTGKPKLLPCKAKDAENISTEVVLTSALEVTLHSPEQTEEEKDVPSYYGEVKMSIQVLCGPPEKSLRQILQLLDSENWENKLRALFAVQDLTRRRPESLRGLLCSLSFAVSAEVKNLRSAVSKTAMATLCVMFRIFKKSMNNVIAETGAFLLCKVLDLNMFIQQQASEALTSMVENCCSLQVLKTLVYSGLVHRAVAVRACAAQNIGNLMKVVGSKKLIQWEALAKVFVLAVRSWLALAPHLSPSSLGLVWSWKPLEHGTGAKLTTETKPDLKIQPNILCF
uniref:CLASP N-terminal domain-containing protein n=1 Tax=Knipowitschia caucasica TaxID=637954 RepID=A0AAV2KDX7_KNICA